MKILALNCGSSSLKYKLYDWEAKEVVAKGVVERIGLEDPFLEHVAKGKETKINDSTLKNHARAIELIMESLTHKEYGVVADIKEVSAVGHRVVHGGDKFTRSVLIDENVIKTIDEISGIAPLHNPPNLDGIRAAMKLLPGMPQVAIFDTAFHQTMPEVAYQYAIPHEWYDEHKVRRYGFHGTSHLYVSKRAAVMLGKPASECNIITMHIGNGASHTAIKNGISIDTSMGFTPLEGAVMGTRSGDLDPAIPLFIQKKTGASASDLDNILNKKSGLLGITGRFVDRRDIEQNADKDPKCKLAMDMEAYRLKKYIGMYTAILGRVDAIVFTAGVGENSGLIRQMALEGLEHMGIIVDKDKNLATRSKAGESVVSKPESKVKVFVIPTDEELVFVEDVVGVLNGNYTDHMNYQYTFLK